MPSCPPSASTPSNQALCQGAIKIANCCPNECFDSLRSCSGVRVAGCSGGYDRFGSFASLPCVGGCDHSSYVCEGPQLAPIADLCRRLGNRLSWVETGRSLAPLIVPIDTL